MENWESESLKWLHKIRENNYVHTKDKQLKAVMAESKNSVTEISKALNLKVVDAPTKQLKS